MMDFGNHELHQMTRKGRSRGDWSGEKEMLKAEMLKQGGTTDFSDIHGWRQRAQGGARGPGLALHFQIPSQASLHGTLKTHRSLAPRLALLGVAPEDRRPRGRR